MSPLRHSPLARPVPPPPHAWEANVTYRSGLPRLRGRWPAGPERARDEKNDGNESPKTGISFLSFPVAKSFLSFQTFREAFVKTYRMTFKKRA